MLGFIKNLVENFQGFCLFSKNMQIHHFNFIRRMSNFFVQFYFFTKT